MNKECQVEYEEFLVTDGNGNLCGYYKNYDEAMENANKQIQSEIYGAHWVSSKFKGLLHKEWEKVKGE